MTAVGPAVDCVAVAEMAGSKDLGPVGCIAETAVECVALSAVTEMVDSKGSGAVGCVAQIAVECIALAAVAEMVDSKGSGAVGFDVFVVAGYKDDS